MDQCTSDQVEDETDNSQSVNPSTDVTTKLSATEEKLKHHILLFSKAVSERNVTIMIEFRKLMRAFSQQTSFESIWFDESGLERLKIKFQDQIASCLYFQMYYHYYFESHPANADVCIWAITNMGDLFNAFNRSNFYADISTSWLWSIIDDFVSLFEALHQFQNLPDIYSDIAKTAKPMLLLNPLNELMMSSKVLKAIESKSLTNEVTSSPFIRALGYYSIVGLIRYHTFDGDYTQALNLIDQVSLSIQDQKLYSGNVIPCILVTNFYAAFCLLMSRRYMQCINVLSDALHFIFDKDFELKISKSKCIPYYIRKMCHTLALVLTIYPIQINEHILNEMKSVVGSRYNRLQDGDATAFSEVFLEAVPCCPYNFGDLELAQKTKSKEYRAFLQEIDEQLCYLRLRAVLVNYSSISIQKLSSIIHKAEIDTISYLMSWKHKLALPQCKTNAEMIKSHLAIDFYIDRQMIHVFHVKPADKYSALLLEQNISIRKLLAERHWKIKI
ncbi:hypothetical protein GJ496_002849 [Pomphorhynchus laevis]|nr:hypothetical protein GJ496_002849 [Pomphorhynchus laevis]